VQGEECVCTTWDIFHEKLGWMLIYWNMCGVPLAYSFQSVFILHHTNEIHHSKEYMIALFVTLFIAYYVWDTANSQKNRFRMMEEGSYTPRPWALPQLPWGTLHNPSYIATKQGNKLLTDGWYRFGRKIHYTADITMALCWGLSCGVTHFLPFYYVSFFVTFLVFRSQRDFARCAAKYGDDWKEYVKRVPYSFIPGIF
jgi:delta24(24(1))-sterol reductase